MQRLTRGQVRSRQLILPPSGGLDNFANVNLQTGIEIPENDDNVYMEFDHYSILNPHYNEDPVLPVVEVQASGDNQLPDGSYDFNFGHMIQRTYPRAFQMARRRLYLTTHPDGGLAETTWMIQEMNTHEGVAPEQILFTHPQYGNRKVRVRAIISGLPAYVEAAQRAVELSSVNVLVNQDNQLTSERLYAALLMEYFSRNFRGLHHIQGSHDLEISFYNHKSQIRIAYLFQFVNEVPEHGLVTRTDALSLNFPYVAPRATLHQPSAFAYQQDPEGRFDERSIRRSFRTAEIGSIPGRRMNPVRAGTGRRGFDGEFSLYSRKLDFYDVFSEAINVVPNTEEQLCFPMAFMCSELRKIIFSDCNNKITDIRFGDVMEILIAESDNHPDECRYFRNDKIFLFSRLIDWNQNMDTAVWVAKRVHDYVCLRMQKTVDVNDFGECLQAYSYVFGVNISVYTKESNRRLLHQACVYDNEPHEQWFISMIQDGDHLHGVKNILMYKKGLLKSKDQYKKDSFYCEYCDKVDRRWGEKAQYEHQLSCRGIITGTSLYNHHMSRHMKYAQVCCNEKTRMKWKKNEQAEGDEPKSIRVQICKICSAEIDNHDYHQHNCYFKPKELEAPINDSLIWVYDIESYQHWDETSQQYIHRCHLVCMAQVYGQQKQEFHDIETFVAFLITLPEGSVVLAHNGGSYDHQFVVRVLERNSVPHELVCSPNSQHHYLAVNILNYMNKIQIRLIDFMKMFTASLANIGEAFKLPVCKGDFPHNFSTADHLDYIGPLPELDNERDYYCFKTMKSAEKQNSAEEYWKSEKEKRCYCHGNDTCWGGKADICATCNKPFWDYKKELARYCWLDVEVLAQACAMFRDKIMSFTGSGVCGWKLDMKIDPFHYMTQGQIALALFTNGTRGMNIAVTHEKIPNNFNPKSIMWLEMLNRASKDLGEGCKIQHLGNSRKGNYVGRVKDYVDGFCSETNTVFLYYDCEEQACPHCYRAWCDTLDETPKRSDESKIRDYARQLKYYQLKSIYKQVVIHWSHDDPVEWGDEFFGCDLMHMRDFFYGGRTEVFAAMADLRNNPDKDEIMCKDDVCSLYPYVCAFKKMPIGLHQVFFGVDLDTTKHRLHPLAQDPFFGFARIKVRPNTKDWLGILPFRDEDTGRLVYDLHEKVGCWHTELIYLAIECGYEILEVYEVWHWSEDQCSNEVFRGYMDFFLKMKQQAEGWEKLAKGAKLNIIDHEGIIETLFHLNGGVGRIEEGLVETNPVLRQLAKVIYNLFVY